MTVDNETSHLRNLTFNPTCAMKCDAHVSMTRNPPTGTQYWFLKKPTSGHIKAKNTRSRSVSSLTGTSAVHIITQVETRCIFVKMTQLLKLHLLGVLFIFGGVQMSEGGNFKRICLVEELTAEEGPVLIPKNVDICTHVIYRGVFHPPIFPEDAFPHYNVIEMQKSSTKNLKIILSFWVRQSVTADEASVNFTQKVLKFCQNHSISGLDFRWGDEFNNTPGFDPMIKKFRDAINNDTTAKSGNFSLSVTVWINPRKKQKANWNNIQTYLDFINIPLFEIYEPQKTGKKIYTQHHSLLYPNEQNKFNMRDTATKWVTERGVPAEKLVVGFTTKERTYEIYETHHDLNDPATDPKLKNNYQICELNKTWTMARIGNQSSPYRYEHDSWISYDDKESITEKACWIKEQGFAGSMMMDQLSIDDPDNQCQNGRFPFTTQLHLVLSNATYPCSRASTTAAPAMSTSTTAAPVMNTSTTAAPVMNTSTTAAPAMNTTSSTGGLHGNPSRVKAFHMCVQGLIIYGVIFYIGKGLW
uniref:chitinase-3-like protein 1 n=1 Tax=Myxine glutinosa TaxID=7769 RepID=UPI003590081D